MEMVSSERGTCEGCIFMDDRQYGHRLSCRDNGKDSTTERCASYQTQEESRDK